uniref:Uncharacterized protein LOC8267042 isoform X2 n=1 Tax=Rhizophora mucronata TaxID=61149 RepID=A0A2P2NTC1_RHIMU
MEMKCSLQLLQTLQVVNNQNLDAKVKKLIC